MKARVSKFVADARCVLDGITVTPEAIANFTAALEDHSSDLYSAMEAIAGVSLMAATVSLVN